MKLASVSILLILSFVSTAQQYTTKYPDSSYSIFDATKGISKLYTKDKKLVVSWTDFKTIEQTRKNYKAIGIDINGRRKWGLFDEKEGRVVLPQEYDHLLASNGGNFVILRTGQLFGVFKPDSNKLIKPIYKGVISHVNLQQIITTDGKDLFVLNTSLDTIEIIRGFYKKVHPAFNTGTYSQEYVAFSNGEYEGLIDKKNQLIAKKEWKQIVQVWDTTIAVYNGKNYGIYNLKRARYQDEFTYTKAVKDMIFQYELFARGDEWSFINRDGIIEQTLTADSAKSGVRANFFYYKKNGLWGIMTSKGKIIQEPIWADVRNTDENLITGILPNRKSKQYQLVFDERSYELIGIR